MTNVFNVIRGLSLPAAIMPMASHMASASSPVYFVSPCKRTSRTNEGGAVPFAIACLTGAHQVR